VYDNSYYLRWQDSGVACDVLAHLKPPQLHEKLKDFLEGYCKVAGGRAANGNIWVYNNNEAGKNGFRLVEDFASKDLAEILLKIVDGQVVQRSQGAMNNEKYFWSNRTMALATLVSMVGQKPADYELKRSRFMAGMWTAPTEADEDAAVKKINAWWAKNGAGFGGKEAAAPAKGTVATQPASKPEEPGQGANVAPKIEIHQVIQGKMIQGGQVHIQIQPEPAPEEK
jgi:hypothetical protein